MTGQTPSCDDLREMYQYSEDGADFKSRRPQRGENFDRAICGIEATALEMAAAELTELVEEIQSGRYPNNLSWQTGALAMRDQLRKRAKQKQEEAS